MPSNCDDAFFRERSGLLRVFSSKEVVESHVLIWQEVLELLS